MYKPILTGAFMPAKCLWCTELNTRRCYRRCSPLFRTLCSGKRSRHGCSCYASVENNLVELWGFIVGSLTFGPLYIWTLLRTTQVPWLTKDIGAKSGFREKLLLYYCYYYIYFSFLTDLHFHFYTRACIFFDEHIVTKFSTLTLKIYWNYYVAQTWRIKIF